MKHRHYKDLKIKLCINLAVHEGQYDVDISGAIAEFASLTSQGIEIPTGIFLLKNEPDDYFPIPMKRLSIKRVIQSNGVLMAQVADADFIISGDARAFQKLTDFLESLSNLRPGEHFHLDWFANETMLSPDTSSMSFIFSVRL